MAVLSLNHVQRAVAGVLSGTATVLTTAASIVNRAARSLRPDGDGRTAPTTAAEIVDIYDDRGRVKEEPAAVAVPQAPDHATRPDTHVAELAERPASEVIDAIDGLSTEQLRVLLEHEQTHKRRKTVLSAIERAAADHAGT